MKLIRMGLATAFAVSLAGAALAIDETEEIVDSEQPGSVIQFDVPLDEGDAASMLPQDPDYPDTDPIDAELPGQGPEDLSGPGDEFPD
jgi:hypothetical protein